MNILTHCISDHVEDERFLFDGTPEEFEYIRAEIISEHYATIESEVKTGSIISKYIYDDLKNYGMLQWHFNKHYPNKVTK